MSVLDRKYYVPCLSHLVDFARKNGPIDFRMDIEERIFSIGVEYKAEGHDEMKVALIQMPADKIDGLIEALQAIKDAYDADNNVPVCHVQTIG